MDPDSVTLAAGICSPPNPRPNKTRSDLGKGTQQLNKPLKEAH
jgi:hypothetical protein